MTQLVPEQSTTDQAADVVLLAVPASGAWLGVLRTATASLASRLSFTLDEIEDLRIAVDEACAILLALASLDAVLSCRFTVTENALTVDATVPTDNPATVRLPSGESFAWQVLSALADDVAARVENDQVCIRLTKRRPT
ncbi:anti-sigma regulatory factor [Planosporangium flavigriseum]|uniref:Anti-sigma regulatory factor n=1 Tax=Planosporangium flavigriseum TaxID=373681 RepID=A0A8J3LQL6_9ACTN|nr:anti-sigma regulatory factor [Planosporangium flavigriseum]NJC66696.1 anti-sigma regulatory factor [Planosporangium flavigriseum]GIG74848.1 anti-sigma regulatory factor [Planosporangium flavigriseum]